MGGKKWGRGLGGVERGVNEKPSQRCPRAGGRQLKDPTENLGPTSSLPLPNLTTQNTTGEGLGVEQVEHAAHKIKKKKKVSV